ncbi:tyrosine-type recombinase/integrase [Ruegeria sp. Alg231-54]|uniref:tyrosine-type recombinase/integrase n=1 Tax=Ruegeria sp. Alg231-54 TaxID=1922221 RepID=UPI000D5510B0|nr:tyrosine-type recombinase/integrase [Ruegeria sp. Alg231-54]
MASIHHNKRGWTVRWELGRNKDGKRSTSSKTFKTEPEAIAHKLYVERLKIGTGKESLEARWMRWIEDRLAVGKITEKTAVGYREKCRGWGNLIGPKPYKQITTADIDRALAQLCRGETPTGRIPSPRTIHHYQVCLKTFFTHMWKKGEIERPPTLGMEMVTASNRTKRAPTIDELQAIITEADQSKAIYGLMGFILRLAAHTGLRRGELFGLRWQDVDFNAGRITIRQAATQPTGKKSTTFKEPKTEAGHRTISIEPATVDLLRKHKVMVRQWQLAAGSVWANNDLVLCDPAGQVLNMSDVSKIAGKIRDKSGVSRDVLPIHGTRHYNITQMAKLTKDYAAIQRRAGHASYESTNRYITTDEEQDRDLAEAALRGLI